MIALEDLLASNVWLSLAVWGILYASDYYLTIYAAHLYRARVKEHVVFEGSYELTPQFQKDVDSLRWFSPRFLVGLVLSVIIVLLIWELAVVFLRVPQLFTFAIGGSIFRELVVHARHARNIVLFRSVERGGVKGRLEYARWLTLRISATELLTFAALFLVIFLVVRSYLVLGGAVFVLATGLQHWSWSGKLYRAARPRM